MKSLLKKSQKEAEGKRQSVNLNFSLKYRRWIGLTVYPFFMLFSLLTANGQDNRLSSLLQLDFNTLNQQTCQAESPLDLYYQNLGDIFQVILFENETEFKELSKNKDIRLDALDELNVENDPWYGFVKSEIKFQWAFVNFKYGNDWDAFWGLRSAFRSINRNEEKFPDFEPNKRTLGLLNVIFGNVPSKNQWLMNLFGLKGDVYEGLALLENVSGKVSNIALESDLVLGMIHAFLLEDFPKAIAKVSDNGAFQKTPLVQYVNALVQLKAHNAMQARNLLESSVKRTPFHDYLTAESYFQAQDYPKAITLYEQFLNTTQGSSYVKDAYLKIALSHLFTDDQKQYEKFLKLAIENGDTQSEIDKNAVKIIDDLPNRKPITLKIRFAIDGGFYGLANEMITAYEPRITSNYERLELIYRKARIKHLNGEPNSALTYYREVIESADLIAETYYGPNSFLQAGYLMREKGDKTSALMYFERVLKLKKHPYKTSLDSKARIAIKRLDSTGD